MTSTAPPLPTPRALLREHGPAVWTLCRRLSSEPQDDYQAIWIKVFSALERAEVRDGLGPWVATIARRHLIDRHRRSKVRGEVVELAQHATTRVDPGSAVDRARRHADLEAALLRLSAPQRRAVVLHHIQGVPLEQLAQDEGVPLGTVKSRLHRGRAHLAELLRGRHA
jgi:RNA polymerase sigma factor (sigma-70 family)